MPQVCCKYCGKIFKEQRYLDTHLEKGKECKKLRGVLFFCLRCNCFHTTKFGKLERHLEKCKGEGRVIDIVESYQSRVKELQTKIKILEESSGRLPEVKNQEEEKDIVELAFGTFTEDSPDLYFQQSYESLTEVKQYNTHLRKIKNSRRGYFSTVSLEEYTNAIKSHITYLEKFGKQKKFTTRKVDTIVSNHFTTLDLRLVRHKNYENFHPDGTLLKDLNLILSCKDNVVFDYDIIGKFRNYALLIFPLKVILEFILYNRSKTEPVFVLFDLGHEDNPFHYYYLNERKGSKKYWIMDCRMEIFLEQVRSSFLPYLVSEFRTSYFHIFQDNIFRENFLELVSGLETECKQIVENIMLLANSKKTAELCKQVVSKNARKKTPDDVLNLIKNDPLKIELVDESEFYVAQLFDNSPKNLLNMLKNIG